MQALLRNLGDTFAGGLEAILGPSPRQQRVTPATEARFRGVTPRAPAWPAEAKALEAGLPSNVALPIHAATSDHEFGICIWEGESVNAVREVVEGAVGPWANNEYFEMHVDGLAPQLASQ